MVENQTEIFNFPVINFAKLKSNFTFLQSNWNLILLFLSDCPAELSDITFIVQLFDDWSFIPDFSHVWMSVFRLNIILIISPQINIFRAL